MIGCDGMAVHSINAIDILQQYEERFRSELESNSIKILREIKLSKEEVDEIAKNISTLFKRDKNLLKCSFPITVSLFLVWFTVYEYDGKMWPNIFRKLQIPHSINNMSFLGDIFLEVLDKCGLIKVEEGEGKKYLSPILMHGYISNYYAYNLFNYLNRIYSIVLEGDTSEEAIDDIWDDIFNKDMELTKILDTIKNLEEKKKDIENGLEYYRNLDEEIKKISHEDVNDLETEVLKIENELKENREKIEMNERKLQINLRVSSRIIKISSRLSKISNRLGNDCGEDIKDVSNLIYEIERIIQDKNIQLKNRIEFLLKETKGLENKLAVNRERLVTINTKIASLGKGNLEDGWEEIKEYHELKEELENVELQIRRYKIYQEVAEGEKNTTLNQVLTTSLNHLRMSSPYLFKEFITSTIQMMGAYFTEGRIDRSHPLHEVFLEWVNREPEIPDYNQPQNYTQQKDNREQVERRRLALQTMRKPYIKLDTYNFILKIVIPEQRFNFNQNTWINPSYTLVDKNGNLFNVDIDYVYNNQTLYINEEEILLESTSYDYLYFQWYNLKEAHDISLSEVMVFDETGTLLNKNKVKNGHYYIVCSDSYILEQDVIISEWNLSLEGYKVYDVFLNETKAVLHNKDEDKQYQIFATDYDGCYLVNYNPIDGIYVGNLPVVTGFLPELYINNISIDPALAKLMIFTDDHLTYQTELSSLINREPSFSKINVYKLLKFKQLTPQKFRIELSYEDRELLKEEFYYLPKIKFKYTNEGLSVTIKSDMRFSSTNYKKKGLEYILPLKDKEGELFSVYYDEYGWVKIWVEVPSVDVKVVHKNGEVFSEDNILYGSRKELLKDLYIQWESNSRRTKSILLFDNNHYLETRIFLKNGIARTSLDPYFDVFRGKDEGKLYYKIEDEHINLPEEAVLELYDKWQVSNIKVYQKEEIDEYIIGIDYDENFSLKDTKYLQILNDGRSIFKKTIRDQIYVYIKKKDLTSNQIKINFLYEDEYEDILLGKVKETIIAGTADVTLKSKIDELEKIIKHGILITGFEYLNDDYTFSHPIYLEKIEKVEAKNFEGEEMYKSCIYSSGIPQNVYFYIDTEKKVLPFLIDDDGDGAQYDPNSGRVFWELSDDKGVVGPLENIKYVIKEGR